MPNILQPADIVEIGIEKEKKRRDFYALAAEKFKDNSDLADLFGRLRDWEKEHIEKFEEILESVSGAHYQESYPGEIEAYMQAIVETELYDRINAESFGELVDSPEGALDMAVKFEKDAILFFSGLSSFIDEKMREIAGKLIAEEQQHIVFLAKMKKEMGL